MNKTQIIAISVMTVVTAIMFTGSIALNSFAVSMIHKPIDKFPCGHHPCHPCTHLGQKNCFPPCHRVLIHNHFVCRPIAK